MKLPLTEDEICRKLAVLEPADAERIIRETAAGAAATALLRKIEDFRVIIAQERA